MAPLNQAAAVARVKKAADELWSMDKLEKKYGAVIFISGPLSGTVWPGPSTWDPYAIIFIIAFMIIDEVLYLIFVLPWVCLTSPLSLRSPEQKAIEAARTLDRLQSTQMPAVQLRASLDQLGQLLHENDEAQADPQLCTRVLDTVRVTLAGPHGGEQAVQATALFALSGALANAAAAHAFMMDGEGTLEAVGARMASAASTACTSPDAAMVLTFAAGALGRCSGRPFADAKVAPVALPHVPALVALLQAASLAAGWDAATGLAGLSPDIARGLMPLLSTAAKALQKQSSQRAELLRFISRVASAPVTLPPGVASSVAMATLELAGTFSLTVGSDRALIATLAVLAADPAVRQLLRTVREGKSVKRLVTALEPAACELYQAARELALPVTKHEYFLKQIRTRIKEHAEFVEASLLLLGWMAVDADGVVDLLKYDVAAVVAAVHSLLTKEVAAPASVAPVAAVWVLTNAVCHAALRPTLDAARVTAVLRDVHASASTGALPGFMGVCANHGLAVLAPLDFGGLPPGASAPALSWPGPLTAIANRALLREGCKDGSGGGAAWGPHAGAMMTGADKQLGSAPHSLSFPAGAPLPTPGGAAPLGGPPGAMHTGGGAVLTVASTPVGISNPVWGAMVVSPYSAAAAGAGGPIPAAGASGPMPAAVVTPAGVTNPAWGTTLQAVPMVSMVPVVAGSTPAAAVAPPTQPVITAQPSEAPTAPSAVPVPN
jgi:hypothetical protein